MSERFFRNFCWYEIVSSIERERKIFLTPSRSSDLLDRIWFAIVFGGEFFEPAIFKRSEDFHRDNFFRLDEEIVVV